MIHAGIGRHALVNEELTGRNLNNFGVRGFLIMKREVEGSARGKPLLEKEKPFSALLLCR